MMCYSLEQPEQVVMDKNSKEFRAKFDWLRLRNGTITSLVLLISTTYTNTHTYTLSFKAIWSTAMLTIVNCTYLVPCTELEYSILYKLLKRYYEDHKDKFSKDYLGMCDARCSGRRQKCRPSPAPPPSSPSPPPPLYSHQRVSPDRLRSKPLCAWLLLATFFPQSLFSVQSNRAWHCGRESQLSSEENSMCWSFHKTQRRWTAYKIEEKHNSLEHS